MSAQITIGQALGSTTRAGIYDHLRQSEDALTVRDVAATFDLHPNVARTHLGLLADAGLLSVGQRKHPGGGRPARIYRAREEGANNNTALDIAARPAGGAAAALMVRLLVDLLDRPGGPPLVARAHQAAREEGRQLTDALPGSASGRRLGEAVDRAVVALRAYAPDVGVARSGGDWAEIDGLSDAVALVERLDPVLAESLERGLLVGACEATGVPVELNVSATGTRSGRTWRLRASGSRAPRSTVVVAASLDARGQSRDSGVVEAMRTMTDLDSGDVLEVLAEGPGSPAVFARWADRAGHALVAVERAQDTSGRPAIRLLIEKAQ